jgi:hypothetical protein
VSFSQEEFVAEEEAAAASEPGVMEVDLIHSMPPVLPFLRLVMMEVVVVVAAVVGEMVVVIEEECNFRHLQMLMVRRYFPYCLFH